MWGEGFVSGAISVANDEFGRVAEQSLFNGYKGEALPRKAQAALEVATDVYINRGLLDEVEAENVRDIKNCGDAKEYVERCMEVINSRR